MKCSNCGKELEAGVAFCPYCGEKQPAGDQGSQAPIYQTDVKGVLRSGRLTVYPDRVEFVVSSVNRMVFRFSSMVSVKKGLDRINFVMEDGRTESCPVGMKNIHEAFYTIENACKPYLAQRSLRIQAEGIRYSFPSSPAGVSGVLGGGILNIMDDRAEYKTSAGKTDLIDFREVKSVRVSATGALEFTLYDGSKKAYSADKAARDQVAAFIDSALVPFIQARKAALLARGIYYSFLSSQGFSKGTVDLYQDKLEYRVGDQLDTLIDFREIRACRLTLGKLEVALVDGTAKSFAVEKELQAEVLSFIETAIQPYVLDRTVGFDLSFGLDEKIEINESRGIFHILRQAGREITPAYPLSALIQVDATEVRSVDTGLGDLSLGYLGLGSTPSAPTSSGQKLDAAGVAIALRTEEGEEPLLLPVRFASFAFGVNKTSSEYDPCLQELDRFFTYLETNFPQCPVTRPEPPEEPQPEVLEGELVTEEPDELVILPTALEPAPDRALEKGQFGTLVDGISDFIAKCSAPMTIAIQGDWGSGNNSFMRMIYDDLAGGGNALWFNTWQFAQADTRSLPSLLAGKLIALMGGINNEELKDRAVKLVKGIISFTPVGGDGQGLVDALVSNNDSDSFEKQVRNFSDLARARAGAGKLIIFVDDLNRLSPPRVVELLDALSYFFHCEGCVFVVGVDQDVVLRGKKELDKQNFSEPEAKRFFSRLFRTSFRVPAASFDILQYVKDNLWRLDIHTDDQVEIAHYAALARLSVGSDPQSVDRLFNSFLLLKSLAGAEACVQKERRLSLFALLCMQNTFRPAYDHLVLLRRQITPDFFPSLCGESAPVLALPGFTEDQRARFPAFAAELCRAISIDRTEGVSDLESKAFVEALNVLCSTSG